MNRDKIVRYKKMLRHIKVKVSNEDHHYCF